MAEVKETVYGLFSSSFREDLLRDVCVKDRGIQTGPFGSQLHQRDYVPIGTPIITVEHLGENRILHDDVPRVSDSDRDRLKRYRLKQGDIVFSRVGSVDRRALVRKAEAGWLFSGRCLRVRADADKIDPVFLSYFFGLETFKEHIRAIAVGATMPSLNTRLLSDVSIFYPPLEEQRAIADILGTLDDKIEQNRHTAQALERLARAVFQAWFVDFEPVKAKSAGAGSFPSIPQHVFDALPTSFVDSEIGPVPEGWEVENIGDVVTVKGGSTPSTKEPDYWDGGEHCWATPKDLSRLSHPVVLDTERHITDAGVDRISSRLLPVGTVLMSSRAPIGYLAIARVPTAVNQGFVAMICDGPLPPAFILNWAHSSMETIKGRAGGTTFPEISKKNFRPIPVIKPTDEVVAAYGQAVDPLFDLLTACVKENECLAKTRDYILPRLLSGQVTVEVADG